MDLHEKTAWLIERQFSSGPFWLCVLEDAVFILLLTWTDNANRALKFADQDSAAAFLKWQSGKNASQEALQGAVVTEHSWPDGW